MPTMATLAQLGAAQGLMLVFAVLSVGHGNRAANRVLALFIGVLSLRLFLLALEYQSFHAERFNVAVFSLLHLSYAIGPLLFFYVRLLTVPENRLALRDAWHFLPIPLAALLMLPGGPVLPLDLSGYNHFNALPDEIRTRVILASTPVFLSLGIYSSLCLRMLKRYHRSIRERFSALESINLDWLRMLVWFCLTIASFSFFGELYRAFALLDIGPRSAYSVVFSVALIYYMGLRGLRQPLIFDQSEGAAVAAGLPEMQGQPELGEHGEKYQKSGLGDEQMESIWRKLQACMESAAPYLQPGIKLADIARMVGTRANYLSQTINSRAGESFFDYINRHRVEYAKTLLLSEPDMTVSEVALRAGFNSQNVFNGHFKKRVGKTPTQFRKLKGYTKQ
ncbi:helix-turn-helix domain-containing protein [Litorivivens sp.]|uniref:AraC family transcriptional regulator n=1 Tax=Litorivivens sp. TaxID=2020868 RepID=UPI00356AC4DC